MISMNSIFLSAYPTTSKDDKLSGSQNKQISAIDSKQRADFKNNKFKGNLIGCLSICPSKGTTSA